MTIVLIAIALICTFLILNKMNMMVTEVNRYFSANRAVIEGQHDIIGKQHELIQKLLADRLAMQEKADEIGELLPQSDHDKSVVIMWRKLEEVKKAIDTRLPPESQIAKELKEILE